MRIYYNKELDEKFLNVNELLNYVDINKNVDVKEILKNKINSNVEYFRIGEEYYTSYCGSYLLLNYLHVDFDKQGLRKLFI